MTVGRQDNEGTAESKSRSGRGTRLVGWLVVRLVLSLMLAVPIASPWIARRGSGGVQVILIACAVFILWLLRFTYVCRKVTGGFDLRELLAFHRLDASYRFMNIRSQKRIWDELGSRGRARL